MVTDYIFALLPLQIIRGLNMSNRSKWLLVPLFLMGTVYVYSHLVFELADTPKSKLCRCCAFRIRQNILRPRLSL